MASFNAPTRAVLGGWQWSGLLNVKSGEPVTVGLGVYANAGEVDGPLRPNQIANAMDSKGMNDWINPSSPSNLRQRETRQWFVCPATPQMDSSLSKDFPVYERFKRNSSWRRSTYSTTPSSIPLDTNYYVGSTTFGHLNNTLLTAQDAVGHHLLF